MSLDYSKLSQMNFGVPVDKQEEAQKQFVLSEINFRVEKTRMKQAEIDNLSYEKTLITEDIINIIRKDLTDSRNNLFCWADLTKLCFEAYSCQKSYKTKENLTEKERQQADARDIIVDTIKKEFFLNNEDFIYNNISMYGYQEAYAVEFVYKKQLVHVYIPVFPNANTDNYLTLLAGYQVIYQEGESAWNTITYGFNFQKIAADIQMWATRVDKGEICFSPETKKEEKETENIEKN